MLTLEKALEIVLDSARVLGTERIGLAVVVNRVLAEDVRSDTDIPPFNKSAMDGFACRREDLGNELTVVETVAAGEQPEKSIGVGECSMIMTGAAVPQGADCVIMVEFTQKLSENVVRFIGKETSDNICVQGEDIRAGEVVLEKGTVVGPKHIATLASVGCANPLVYVRPRVGVIATGSELVAPSQELSECKIRDSNSFQLVAQTEAVGAVTKNYGIASDTKQAIDAAVKKAMSENDVVFVCGGVSVGEFDFVPEVLRANGFKLLFEKIAIKPGKPTVFGQTEQVYCFGVPGNPVSGFVIFEVLIKPFLYKLMGYNFEALQLRLPLATTVTQKKAGSPSWIPVAITKEGKIEPVEYHGSSHFGSLNVADGLICLPKGPCELREGTLVTVRCI
jgi:molybdopterin molybdotransferase